MIKKFLALAILVLFTSACAHQQTLFVSEPEGAAVFVDGEAVGQTPCNFEYKLSAGQKMMVTVEKPGYQPISYTLRTDEVDAGERNKWLAAGVIWSPLWLGTLFTKKLKDSYEIVMQQDIPRVTAASSEDKTRF